MSIPSFIFTPLPLQKVVATVLIPGTHDPIAPGSIYERWLAEGLPDGVHLLTAEQPTLEVPDLDVAIHFAEDAKMFQPNAQVPFNIGVLHGSVQIPGWVDDDAVIVTQAQIAGCGMNYLALGHWHAFGDYSQGEVPALYPGSPEIVALDQAQQGQVLLVDLDDEGQQCSWQQVTTGSLRYQQREFDLAQFGNVEELIQAILELAGEHTILDAELLGMAPEQMIIDPDRILARVEDEFFRIRLTDQSQLLWEEPDHQPAGLVAQRFRELAQEQFAAAEGDRQCRMVRRARSLGLALLAGKEVLR